MDLGNYGIGGNEVKIDASEGIAEIPQNRTLLVEQLTKDEPVAPEVITGLTNIDQVFAHFLPEIDIEFTDAEGAPVEENFRFHNVGDFSVKKMTEQSHFLSGLNTEKQFADRMEKSLRSNKVLQRVFFLHRCHCGRAACQLRPSGPAYQLFLAGHPRLPGFQQSD